MILLGFEAASIFPPRLLPARLWWMENWVHQQTMEAAALMMVFLTQNSNVFTYFLFSMLASNEHRLILRLIKFIYMIPLSRFIISFLCGKSWISSLENCARCTVRGRGMEGLWKGNMLFGLLSCTFVCLHRTTTIQPSANEKIMYGIMKIIQ